MQTIFSRSLLIALAVAAAPAALAKEPATASRLANEAATSRHYAALIAGQEPKLAELTMFFTQMPKGGDLHHHYSGAIYVEQYLDFLDRQGLCVNKQTYRIETDKAVIATERAKPAKERTCLNSAEVYADDHTWRELVQRWSNKDFDNHGVLNPPPDRLFFQTFGYFGPVSNANFAEGLQELKKRAIAENVSYIETMFKMAPAIANADFDAKAWQFANDDASLNLELRKAMEALERDPAFGKSIADFVAKIDQAAAGIDDERFTMRYQTYVLRLLNPSQVFSSMVAAFKSAAMGGKVVGVNIVGQESTHVSMRDYALHMKMFGFLKSVYPQVKVAMHAGELALGDVPPEGLKFHIDQALVVAKADRIGHGIDLAHESNAAAILRKMRADDIPVEINLTSNGFISGIKGENHPVTLYRKYGVPYVISTDDAGVTRHTLSQEYVLFASRYKPDYAEMKKTAYNSIRYAFLPAADKARLTRRLDARFAAFEAEVAGLAKTAVGAKPKR
ncbi:adenosine deaminase [Massilia sp. Leaf139]|uniref:adenosine deaminase n=1 Tax=Massilia sp. Leaf139 TaxID=1736272 RepID=UPI0006F41B24|nr:adenosine deaminase [Massilia sp. Leaf139]KQQ91732.1 adenosine deaminase [Massilia sp. Leaf139]